MHQESRGSSGVLLDVDGVILDSYSAFKTVWRDWADGHQIHFETVWAATHGRRPIDTIQEVAPHLDAYLEYSWLQSRVKEPDLKFPPIAGARSFLSGLPKDLWALVTSSYEPLVRERLRSENLPEPAVIVDGLAVKKGKPAPHCYVLGASPLGVAPGQCLVVEDSPAGITAGLEAGCYVVGLSSTHARHELAEAHQVVASLEEARQSLDTWRVGLQNGVERSH